MQHVLARLGEGAPELGEFSRVYLARTGYAARAHEVVKLTEALLRHTVYHGLAVHCEGHLIWNDPALSALFKREIAAGISSYLVSIISHNTPTFLTLAFRCL